MSFFDSTSLLPEDPIFRLPILFNQDPRPHKVNLGIGAYHDDEGKPLVLACVKKAEAALLGKERSKDYLPIQGMQSYIEQALTLMFGKHFTHHPSSFFGAQTLGGTGALRVGAEFLVQGISKTIFISEPTWPNHRRVFSKAGMDVQSYAYYDKDAHSLDFDGMCQDVGKMPPGSVILLQPCCHNPTGIDLSQEQWKELSRLIKTQKILPFFDMAYQGFRISVEEDAWPLCYFAKEGHEMLAATSFSKNFGLYGERVGALAILPQHEEAVLKVGSHIKQIIRGNYSNPPTHGAKMISFILSSEELKQEWLKELDSMRLRLKAMRKMLIEALCISAPHHPWPPLEQQHGFFSYLGLSTKQAEQLMAEYGIYLPSDGRINVAGLNAHNRDYVVRSIVDVIRT